MTYSLVERMVRSRGLEPPRVLPHSDLNAARLPIPPRPHCLGLVKRRLANASGDVKRKSAPLAEIIALSLAPAACQPEKPAASQQQRCQKPLYFMA